MLSKKYLSALILVGALAVLTAPFFVSADMWAYPKGTISGDNAVKTVMTAIFTPIWQLCAGLAVIMFVFAGILFLTSMGDPSKITTARNAVIWGVIGIIVAIFAFSIVGLAQGWVTGGK